jgi:3-oxoacyl-[acyl-carrier-protein] synthase II
VNEYRVVVTGMGALSPVGTGRDGLWEGILSESVAVAPITRFDTTGYASRIAAQIDDFEADDYMEPKRLRWTDRFAQFAIAATRMAIDDAGFHVNGGGSDVGVYLGSALGGLAFADEQHDVFREKGLGAVKPLLAISAFAGSSVCNVSIEFGLSGPTVANGMSCAAGTIAIGEAYRAIARGDTRAAIAGGIEAPLAPLVFGAFTVIRAMSTRNDDPQHASRPFDRDRDGFVMAEGAGVFLLERYEDAVARDAQIYGEIIGFGISNDAYHMAAPRPDGAQIACAIQRALSEAHVAPAEIEMINAHGSGTPLGDKAEATALRRAFGEAIDRIPVTATKGQHGHALGATGAWEVALSLLSICRRRVPRVVNLIHDDPDVRLRFARTALDCAPRLVVSNSSGFGGINAALVFKAVA